MGHPELVLVSNRGPVAFSRREDGDLHASRGAGGLVSSLGPLVQGTGAMWIAAAISDDDREAASQGRVDAEGFRLRLLAIDADAYRLAYDVVSNATLWFLLHGLWDLPRRPRFDRRWREAWEAYRAVNETFAAAVADEAPEGGVVLVQDYHLALVGESLARSRPDVTTVHFAHTPFCSPQALRVLPDDAAEQLMRGLAGHGACGFHTERWARLFEACCNDVLDGAPATFVAPLAPDVADLRNVAESDACAAQRAGLDELVGDRKLLLRVDRMELSKNLPRGFLAFDELLETRPEWRERVVFAAYVYPSRQSLAEYRAYATEVHTLVDRINDRWGTATWTPIVLDDDDDFPRSVAALQRYDVLLVNPIADGMNMVAKEGALLNERDGVVVLSREAGAYDEFGGRGVLGVNPFDVAATADALHRALAMGAPERAALAAQARAGAESRTPQDWLDDQLRAGRADAG